MNMIKVSFGLTNIKIYEKTYPKFFKPILSSTI